MDGLCLGHKQQCHQFCSAISRWSTECIACWIGSVSGVQAEESQFATRLRVGVTGGPNLRGTQVYTEGYAEALLDSWNAADATDLETVAAKQSEHQEDLWLDAGMSEVAAYSGVHLVHALV